MIERLIELIEQAGDMSLSEHIPLSPEMIANHLMRNGAEIPVHCCDCRYADPSGRMVGETWCYCLHPLHSFTYGQGWDRTFNPVKESDDFCSCGERKGALSDDNHP